MSRRRDPTAHHEGSINIIRGVSELMKGIRLRKNYSIFDIKNQYQNSTKVLTFVEHNFCAF